MTAPKPTFETSIGLFIRVYSKRGKNIWSNNSSEIVLTARGSEQRPFQEHLDILLNFEQILQNLDAQINKKFRREFQQAGFEVSFKQWQDKFKLSAIAVMDVFESENYFSVTFEDNNEPYAHYTIFVEGNKINPDFAIDT